MFDPVLFEPLLGLLADSVRSISLALGDPVCDAILGGFLLRFAASGALAHGSQINDVSH
jgi:hypothetical protein